MSMRWPGLVVDGCEVQAAIEAPPAARKPRRVQGVIGPSFCSGGGVARA
jgi:hypothetical protein